MLAVEHRLSLFGVSLPCGLAQGAVDQPQPKYKPRSSSSFNLFFSSNNSINNCILYQCHLHLTKALRTSPTSPKQYSCHGELGAVVNQARSALVPRVAKMAEQLHGNQHRRERSIPQIRLERPLPALPLLPTPVSPIAPRIRIQIPEEWEPYQDEPSEDEAGIEEGMIDIRDAGRRIQRRVEPQPNGLLSPVTPRSSVRSPSRRRAPEFQPYRDEPRDMSLSPNTPTIGISQCPSLASSNSSRRSSGSTQAVSPTDSEGEANKPPEYEPMYDYLRSRPPPIHFRTSPNSNTFLSPTSHPQSPVEYVSFTDEERPFIITLSPLSPHTRGEPLPPSYEELFQQYRCPQQRDELQDMVQEMNTRGERAEDVGKFLIGMLILALTVVGVGTAFNWGKPGGW